MYIIKIIKRNNFVGVSAKKKISIAKIKIKEFLPHLYPSSVLFDVVRVPGRIAQSVASDSRARGPGFDIRSSHILSFLLVTGERMCTKYLLIAQEV